MATTYTMPQGTYIPPKLNERRFTCPLCHTLTPQRWSAFKDPDHNLIYVNKHQVWSSQCFTCKDACLWVGEKMIYPDTGNAPLPNGDLSDAVREIYEDAVSVMQKSPRAAAGLLRLAIETLCIELKCDGGNLHDMINSLAEKDSGLQKVVTALNVVRLVGNKSAHAGTIQINENPKIVEGMFTLINYAADRLITAPKTQESIIGDATKLLENTENQESE